MELAELMRCKIQIGKKEGGCASTNSAELLLNDYLLEEKGLGSLLWVVQMPLSFTPDR
jgi:hypothetical protein